MNNLFYIIPGAIFSFYFLHAVTFFYMFSTLMSLIGSETESEN